MRRNLQEPAIAGLVTMPRITVPQAMPQSVDSAEREHGMALYDEMEDTCAEVSLALSYLSDRVFEDGPLFLPNLAPPLDGDPAKMADFEESLRAAAWMTTVMEELADDGNDPELTYRQLFSCLKYGRSVAEMTYRRMSGEWAGWIGLKAFRALPRHNFALVVDPFARILGAIGIQPGKASPILQGAIPNPESWSNFVPASRLVVMIINPADTHPLGQSILRSCYRSWWAMREAEPLELKSMATFAGEGLMLAAGEKTPTEINITNAEGAVERTTVVEYVTKLLAGYQANDVAVLPHGFTRIPVGGDGNSDGFKTFFERHGRRIVGRILYTATMLFEAERNSQAQAGKAENITDTAVRSVRKMFSRVLAKQLVAPLLRMNKGEDYARKYCPVVAMAQMAAPDRKELLEAMASALSSGVITQAMLPKLWRSWLGEEFTADPESRQKGPKSAEEDDDE